MTENSIVEFTCIFDEKERNNIAKFLLLFIFRESVIKLRKKRRKIMDEDLVDYENQPFSADNNEDNQNLINSIFVI